MKDIYYYKNLLTKISNIELNNLNKNIVTKYICDFGLVNDGRPLYGEYTCYMNSPNDELSLWQRPNQLTDVIQYLLNLNINSFLEVGTYKAATFLIFREFLKLKNKNLMSLTIDPNQFVNDEFIKELNIEYKRCDINSIDSNFDLIFIDGNHSYDFVKNDFLSSLKLNPKYILFHDINDEWCPDVVKFWNEIKVSYKNVEFIDDVKVMGFGLIIVK